LGYFISHRPYGSVIPPPDVAYATLVYVVIIVKCAGSGQCRGQRGSSSRHWPAPRAPPRNRQRGHREVPSHSPGDSVFGSSAPKL